MNNASRRISSRLKIAATFPAARRKFSFGAQLLTVVLALQIGASVAKADGVVIDVNENNAAAPGGATASGSATATSAPDAATGAATGAPEVDKGPKLSLFDLARYQYCGEDSDCVVELNGCCQCETGAEEVAINKNRVEAFRAQFTACSEIACGEVLEKTHCGGGVVSCVEHRCRYFAAEEEI